MTWNFHDLVKELGITLKDITEAPESPGYYIPFADHGYFIYVGKKDNLPKHLAYHFSDNEDNERIKGIVTHAIWKRTRNVSLAEEAEGDLYDTWVRNTGLPPFANKNKPPKSKLSENKITHAKLRKIIVEHGILSKKLE